MRSENIAAEAKGIMNAAKSFLNTNPDTAVRTYYEAAAAFKRAFDLSKKEGRPNLSYLESAKEAFNRGGRLELLFQARRSMQLYVPTGEQVGVALMEKDAKNPFRITPEIAKVANNCTISKASLEEKMKSLFLWIHNNINYGKDRRAGNGAYRRSDEVIKTSEGVCGEDAFLYIVMLRYIGAQARYVLVDVDYKGAKVNHACTRILLPREFSSDITYHLYDVKSETGNDHERFKILSDDEAVEHFKAIRWK